MIVRDEAEAPNHAKSEFLANMSHKLRTPFNATLGWTQVFLLCDLEEEIKGAFTNIQQAGEHLPQIINDILDLSKIEAGKMEFNVEPVDLQRAIQTLVLVSRPRAQQKGPEFVVDAPAHLPTVLTDSKRLRQVLLNLLSNATKFTATESVRLRAVDVERRAAVGDKPPTAVLRFEVVDTGAGIASCDMPKLFQAFMQTETGLKSSEGAGLGPPLLRCFFQLMDVPDFEVKSELGQGTTFAFTVPLPTFEGACLDVLSDERRPVGYAGPRRMVLVGDDKASNRLVLRMILEQLGFDVLEADSGIALLEEAHARHPEIILTDMEMPQMTGVEATQLLRTEGWTVSILTVSASVFESEVQGVLDAGCDAFIPKPVPLPRLLSTLSGVAGMEWVYEEVGTTDATDKREADTGSGAVTEMRRPDDAVIHELRDLVEMGGLMTIEDCLPALQSRFLEFATALGAAVRTFDAEHVLAVFSARTQ